MKINAKLVNSGDYLDQAETIFERPPNAVTWRGANTLFTLPNVPGMLFKEVIDYAEAEDFDCGIAYSSDDGESVLVLAGETATLCKPIVTALGSMWSGLGDDLGNGTVSHPSLSALLPAYTPGNHESVPVRGKFAAMMGHDYRKYAVAYPHPRPDVTDVIVSPPPEGAFLQIVADSMTTQAAYRANGAHLRRAFVPVCRASYGAVYKPKNFHIFGWLSTTCPLGEGYGAMRGGVDQLKADAPNDIKPYIEEAFQELHAEGEYLGLAKCAIVTYFGSPVNQLAEPLVGVGFALPTVLYLGMTGSEGQYAHSLVKGGPTDSHPVVFPTIHMCSLPGVSDKLGPEVGAWHRFALAAGDDGKLWPLKDLRDGGGDWAVLATPIEVVMEMDTSFEDTIEAPIPIDPDELAAYNPSIISSSPTGQVLNTYYLDHVHGDLVPYYHHRVQRIYQRAETIVKRKE